LAQVFPQWSNRAPLVLGIAVVALALFAPAAVWYWFSPRFTDVGYRPEQPIPFSHKLHAGELQISCFYCHYTVERSAVASVPPTQLCMNCHTLVARDKPSLDPLRQSASSGQPLMWVRVHKIPDYAYFTHAPHIKAGVGCSSCHGNVKTMDRITQAEPLSMGWCLDCHRDPRRALRAPNELLDTAWVPPVDQDVRGAKWMRERHLAPPVDCSGCHR
jgi:hypothetical protein